jgi:hypothetical protein
LYFYFLFGDFALRVSTCSCSSVSVVLSLPFIGENKNKTPIESQAGEEHAIDEEEAREIFSCFRRIFVSLPSPRGSNIHLDQHYGELRNFMIREYFVGR